MEVESKFNPDDWNGYLHTYETIEEYNAAKKLLPHTARIESTKEAKYIPGEALDLKLRADVDNFDPSAAAYDLKDIRNRLHPNANAEDIYKDSWDAFSTGCSRDRTYKLLGKIKQDTNIYYLWELETTNNWLSPSELTDGFKDRISDVAYLLTDFKEVYRIYHGMDDNGTVHYGKCLDLDLNNSYSRSDSISTITIPSTGSIHANYLVGNNVIYEIYASD